MKKGAVAAGHIETARTAANILRDGGNAFDAAVAAHMTACVVEPVLSSFAGGGFLLAKEAEGRELLYDFFVQTPHQKKDPKELDFFPISANFGTTDQVFHIGPGSVAVPGTVKGLFEIHSDLCSLPFAKLAEPAIALARSGVLMNAFQAGAFDIVNPIYRSNKVAEDIYRSHNVPGKLIREGERLVQPELANFMEQLSDKGPDLFYNGDVARRIASVSNHRGGLLTMKDLEKYRVIRRKPLKFNYRNSSVSINPPPSSGGLLIGLALKLLEAEEKLPLFGTADYCELMAGVQKLTQDARVKLEVEFTDDVNGESILHGRFIDMYREQVKGRRKANRGTTQISIIDSFGNMASLTTSNGSGSGVMIPGTGVMLNNMLGEEDLNKPDFFQWEPNRRISSMMAPAIAERSDGVKMVLGSGGSNRIRTAISQVLVHFLDYKMEVEEAVRAPRIHLENGFLNIEEGFREDAYELLRNKYPEMSIWSEPSLFFGGTHACISGPDGFSCSGDLRRGGRSVVLLRV
jgi:gamma-glutamyltranspeptidase/glutathione hydrolase